LEFEIGKFGDFGIGKKEIGEGGIFCLIFFYIWGMCHFTSASSEVIFTYI